MLHALFHAYAGTPVSHAVRDSSWIFAVTEMVHLMMLAVTGGALLIGGIGLTGAAFQFPDRAGAWRGLRGVAWWGLAGLLASGVLLVGVNPLKYYFHPAFRVKMTLLLLAVSAWAALDVLVARKPPAAPGLLAAGAVTVLVLWLGVAAGGRAIGLF